ncbi:MAG: hypothetical protein MJ100_07640 [Ruminococcus sp.]|nr:hypothetical protein [Ruminococcus sp.]
MNENQFNQNTTQFENQPMGNSFYGASGVENVKGKKGKKVALIGGISAAVIVGGGVAAYNCSDFVKNQVKLRTMKADNYYAWVYENNAEEFGKSVGDAYQKAIDQYKEGASASYELKYNLSDSVKNLAKESLLSGGNEDAVFEKFINNTNSVSIKADTKTKCGNTESSVGLDYNSDTLFTLDVAGDIEANDYFFRVPELKEQWIAFSIGSVFDELGGDEALIMNTYKEILKDPASFLSADELRKEISDYTAIWCEATNDVKLEKSEAVEIADITVEYTAATVSFDEQLAVDLEVKLLENLKNDDIIKGIIVDKLGLVDADEYTESIDDEIEYAKDDLEEGEFGTDKVDFTTYIDGKGVIRGFKIADPDGGNVIFGAIGKDDKNIRGQFNAGIDSESVNMTFVADETAKDTYDGSFDITSGEDTVSVTFSSLEIVDNEKGYANGTISVAIPDVSPITVNLSTDGKSQTFGYDINVEGEDYGTIELTFSADTSADVAMPDKSGALELSVDDIESFDFKEYVSEDEMNTFVKTIVEKLGLADDEVNKELDAVIADLYKYADGNIFASTQYDINADDYDFDDDDFDFDYDDFDFDDKDFDFDADDFDIEVEHETKESKNGVWETELSEDDFEITTKEDGSISIVGKSK